MDKEKFRILKCSIRFQRFFGQHPLNSVIGKSIDLLIRDHKDFISDVLDRITNQSNEYGNIYVSLF